MSQEQRELMEDFAALEKDTPGTVNGVVQGAFGKRRHIYKCSVLGFINISMLKLALKVTKKIQQIVKFYHLKCLIM